MTETTTTTGPAGFCLLCGRDVFDLASDGRGLSPAELTKAVNRYARRHGCRAETVRDCTRLTLKAIDEWYNRPKAGRAAR